MILDWACYRFPLITGILVSGWLPFTTGYQNLDFRVFTGYHWFPKFRSQGGSGYHWLPKFQNKGDYRLLLVTVISISVTGYRWLPS